MSWKECCRMSERLEFVALALAEGANVRELCRRFQVSSKTGYKWLERHREGGRCGLGDRSRRPLVSPRSTGVEMTELVIQLRQQHPVWGGRKLKRRLEDLGHSGVPSASTITEILRRHQLLTNPESTNPAATHRFEHEQPNDLWQMDFKGHFELTRGGRCHPLTVLDDHSRYSLGLRACSNERGDVVQRELIEIFRKYGMPRRMLMDNGPPWGCTAEELTWTWLTVWLLRLGMQVTHGRPYHPQTQGKEERFHRTLKAEVLRDRSFQNVLDCQQTFDPWRSLYNHERPHEALGLAVPASRYRASGRRYPESLPAVEYGPGAEVRKVSPEGRLSFQRRDVRIGQAFSGEYIGIRATDQAGIYRVYYCEQLLGTIDLRTEDGDRDSIIHIERKKTPRDEPKGDPGG